MVVGGSVVVVVVVTVVVTCTIVVDVVVVSLGNTGMVIVLTTFGGDVTPFAACRATSVPQPAQRTVTASTTRSRIWDSFGRARRPCFGGLACVRQWDKHTLHVASR